MSTPTLPRTITPLPASQYDTTIHYLSLSALIVCPLIIALPPRKLDAYTLLLTLTTFTAGNQLSKEYTGVTMLDRITKRVENVASTDLPPKAMEMQKRLREEKERRRLGGLGISEAEARRRIEVERKAGVLDLVGEKRAEDKEKEERGLLEKVWMGNEGEDWKAKRDRREKEALAEGKGYGSLIMEQIWEVWSWGKDKNEEVKAIDEKVVAERREGGEKKR